MITSPPTGPIQVSLIRGNPAPALERLREAVRSGADIVLDVSGLIDAEPVELLDWLGRLLTTIGPAPAGRISTTGWTPELKLALLAALARWIRGTQAGLNADPAPPLVAYLNLLVLTLAREQARTDPDGARLQFGLSDEDLKDLLSLTPNQVAQLSSAAWMVFQPRFKVGAVAAIKRALDPVEILLLLSVP